MGITTDFETITTVFFYQSISQKIENVRNVLSISGKSEVKKNNNNGFSVSSTHVWSKKMKVSNCIDFSTLKCRMVENVLELTADFKKQNIDMKLQTNEESKIPIENLD